MRWNETCVLRETTYGFDSEGVPQPTVKDIEVFCNPYKVGASTWSSMYEIGISLAAIIQVRTCDYDGQQDCKYRDEWLSVEYVQEQGDFTILTLRHQQTDSEEP